MVRRLQLQGQSCTTLSHTFIKWILHCSLNNSVITHYSLVSSFKLIIIRGLQLRVSPGTNSHCQSGLLNNAEQHNAEPVSLTWFTHKEHVWACVCACMSVCACMCMCEYGGGTRATCWICSSCSGRPRRRHIKMRWDTSEHKTFLPQISPITTESSIS